VCLFFTYFSHGFRSIRISANRIPCILRIQLYRRLNASSFVDAVGSNFRDIANELIHPFGSVRMNPQRRRFVFVRYNPFRSIPFPTLVIVGAIGVASGVYIFKDLVQNAALEVSVKEEQKKP